LAEVTDEVVLEAVVVQERDVLGAQQVRHREEPVEG